MWLYSSLWRHGRLPMTETLVNDRRREQYDINNAARAS